MKSNSDFKEMQAVAALVQYGGFGQIGLHYQAILAIYEGPVKRMLAEAERRAAVNALRGLAQDLRDRGFESASTVADFHASNTELEETL